MSDPETPQEQYEDDHPLSGDLQDIEWNGQKVEMTIHQMSTVFDETPEAMFRWDRMVREAEAERSELVEMVGPEMVEELEKRMDDAILLGGAEDPSDR